jgi:hypothetical protein
VKESEGEVSLVFRMCVILLSSAEVRGAKLPAPKKRMVHREVVTPKAGALPLVAFIVLGT